MARGAKQLRSQPIVGVLLALSLVQSAEPAKRDPSNVITIVALGDSLTAGFGLSRKQAWPALVAEKMRTAGYDFEVVNAGSSGDTTTGGLRRLPAILRAHHKIDIFVVELGINDAFRGVPIEQIRSNLQAIIDRTREKYPKVKLVIAGMMVPTNMGRDYGREFQAMFPALAKKNKAALIPFILEGVGGRRELNLPDGIHPTAKGHQIVAANVWQVLEPVLQSLL